MSLLIIDDLIMIKHLLFLVFVIFQRHFGVPIFFLGNFIKTFINCLVLRYILCKNVTTTLQINSGYLFAAKVMHTASLSSKSLKKKVISSSVWVFREPFFRCPAGPVSFSARPSTRIKLCHRCFGGIY